MNLRALTDGAVAGTGTVKVSRYLIGAVLISTDGTNAASVTLQKDNASGKKIIEVSTKTPLFIDGYFSTEGSEYVYYSVSGTGASAQFFECNP